MSVKLYLDLLNEIKERQRKKKLFSYYPDAGPLRRELYQKHLKFFNLGKTASERLFMAANRVGKTEGAGGIEVTYHLTGLYPNWWGGKTFDRHTSGWCAGDTSKTVREILQLKLLGPLHDLGTGLIPADLIIDYTRKTGTADAVDTVMVRHKSGGVSTLTFKSYDQKRFSFQGTEQDFIWLDEEPPLDIYTECLLRTTDTTGGSSNGLMLLTFTPLSGMSETVLQFLDNGEINENFQGNKVVITASWDDVPHISEDTKAKLLASIPPYQRDARTKGIPQLGSGAIYPVPESEVFIDDFKIPDHWPKAFGMDVGWNKTAACWAALDRDTNTVYIYAEHYRGQAEPSVHADAIKSKGDWIHGVIDPASAGSNQKDGTQLIQLYRSLGLNLQPADNSVEAGIYQVWQRLSQGRLKIFNSCGNLKQEYRLYRRDESGKIVKKSDHLMDALRYLIMSGLAVARTIPVQSEEEFESFDNNWMS